MEVWSPSSDDVGSVLRARTKDSTGVERGRFTEDTRPTVAEINPLIDEVVSRIVNKVNKPLPVGVHRFALRIAAIGVACEVELSYWPEQIAEGRSPYNELKTRFDEGLAELVLTAQADDGDPNTDDLSMYAVNSFDDCYTPLGMHTRY